MPKTLRIARRTGCQGAFTLIELLVAMAVLVLLVTVIAQMTSGLSSIVSQGDAHIDTDTQARALLDRMAIDMGAMVKRPDVDYYLKGRPTTLTQGTPGQAANDQIAFYSEVPGYFPPLTDVAARSSVSLVAYRVNGATLHMERLCKGLTWNGVSASGSYAMGFLPVPLASPLSSPLPSPMPANLPTPLCTQAAGSTTQQTDDPTTALDYEQIGPQVFRFEYYYVLKGQDATANPATLSIVPWNAGAPASHTSVNGMQDVAGIGVLLAVIDQKSRVLVTKDQLVSLAGQMEDAPSPLANPGDIEQQWLAQVTGSTLPRRATSAIRIYTRCFYLNGVSP